jgi:nickel transport system ATP-binding protein
VLIVRQVYKSYGSGILGNRRRQILKDISFTVEQGECVALIGESGCGKSTLARLILGLEACDSGRIACAGLAVSNRPRHRKALYQNMQPVWREKERRFR